MKKLVAAALAIAWLPAAAAPFGTKDLPEFVLNAGVTVGKAVGCKLSGPKILKATKTTFAIINAVETTDERRTSTTKIFDGASRLGEKYIAQNGRAHCPKVDETLDTIINIVK